MALDVDTARKEGYSDGEIADYLGKALGVDPSAARKEGYSDKEIVEHLVARVPKKAAEPPPTAEELAIASEPARMTTARGVRPRAPKPGTLQRDDQGSVWREEALAPEEPGPVLGTIQGAGRFLADVAGEAGRGIRRAAELPVRLAGRVAGVDLIPPEQPESPQSVIPGATGAKSVRPGPPSIGPLSPGFVPVPPIPAPSTDPAAIARNLASVVPSIPSRVYQSARQGAAGNVQTLAEAVGAEGVAERARGMGASARREQERIEATSPTMDQAIPRAVVGGLQSVPQTLMSMGIAAATPGGIAAKLTTSLLPFFMGAQGQSYDELKAAGFTPEQARFYSTGKGLSESLTEAIPMRALLGMLSTGPGKLLSVSLNYMWKEGGTEEVNTIINHAVDLATTRPDLSPSQMAKELLDTAASIAVTGAVTAGAAGGVARARSAAQSPGRQLGEALQQDIDATQFVPRATEADAVRALSPDNAQLQRRPPPMPGTPADLARVIEHPEGVTGVRAEDAQAQQAAVEAAAAQRIAEFNAAMEAEARRLEAEQAAVAPEPLPSEVIAAPTVASAAVPEQQVEPEPSIIATAIERIEPTGTQDVQPKKEASNASQVRADERQVPVARVEREGGEGKGGANIQLPTQAGPVASDAVAQAVEPDVVVSREADAVAKPEGQWRAYWDTPHGELMSVPMSEADARALAEQKGGAARQSKARQKKPVTPQVPAIPGVTPLGVAPRQNLQPFVDVLKARNDAASDGGLKVLLTYAVDRANEAMAGKGIKPEVFTRHAKHFEKRDPVAFNALREIADALRKQPAVKAKPAVRKRQDDQKQRQLRDFEAAGALASKQGMARNPPPATPQPLVDAWLRGWDKAGVAHEKGGVTIDQAPDVPALPAPEAVPEQTTEAAPEATEATPAAESTHIEDGKIEEVTGEVIRESVEEGSGATHKPLQEMRDNLLAAVGRAIDKAPSREESKPNVFVSFDVPGDGRFKVLNNRERLQQFAAQAKSAFKKAPTPSRKPKQWTPGAQTNAAAVRDMIAEGEFLNAYNLAQNIGSPLAFGATSNNDRPVAYTNVSPVVLDGWPGEEFFAGRSTAKDASNWSVIHVGTALSVGTGASRDDAVAYAEEQIEKAKEAGQDLAEVLKARPKHTPAALEKRWLEFAEKQDKSDEESAQRAVEIAAEVKRREEAKAAEEPEAPAAAPEIESKLKGPGGKQIGAIFINPTGGAGHIAEALEGFTKDFGTQRTFNWYHRTLSTQPNKAKSSPEFGRVHRKVTDNIADAIYIAMEAHSLAPNVLPLVEKVRQIGKMPPAKKDMANVMDAIAHGTLYGGPSPLQGRRWTHAELKQAKDLKNKGLPLKFAPMNDRQIKLYDEALDATAAGVDEIAKSIMFRLQRKSVKLTRDIFDKVTVSDAAQTVRDVATSLRDAAKLRLDAALTAKDEAAISKAQNEITDLETLLDIESAIVVKDASGKVQQEFTYQDDKTRDGALATVQRTTKRAQPTWTVETVDAKKGLVTKVEENATGLRKHGYFPLKRFGRYYIVVTDKKGKVVERLHYDLEGSGVSGAALKASSRIELRNRDFRKLTALYAKTNPDYTVSKGVLPQQSYQMYGGITPDVLELFAGQIDIPVIDANGQLTTQPLSNDAMVQVLLKDVISTRSAMKQHIHRKGIPGFSRDTARVLATFIESAGRLASSNYHTAETNDAWSDIPEHKGDVKDEATALIRYIQDPNAGSSRLANLAFNMYLGGEFGQLIVNRMQPISMGAPWLVEQGASTAEAFHLLFSKSPTDQAYKDALQKYKDSGLLAPQELHQLRSYGRAQIVAPMLPPFLRQVPQKAAVVWGAFMSISEQANREQMFKAAWLYATKHPNVGDREEFVQRAVKDTQVEYGRANISNWARNVPSIFIFMQMITSYVEMGARMILRGKFKAAALMLFILWMFAGAEGQPFAENFEDIFDFLTKTNSRKRMRTAVVNASYDLLSGIMDDEQKAADLAFDITEAVFRGPVSVMTGIDFSGRFGMGKIMRGTSMLQPGREVSARDIGSLLGPVGGLLASLAEAWGYVGDEEKAKAAKALAPRAAQNVATGAKMLETGKYVDKRDQLVADVTKREALFKMVGLHPESLGAAARARAMIQQDLNARSQESKRIVHKWARGILADDDAAIDAAINQREAWNEKNPDFPIVLRRGADGGVPTAVKEAMRNMERTANERMLKRTPKAAREGVGKALEGFTAK